MERLYRSHRTISSLPPQLTRKQCTNVIHGHYCVVMTSKLDCDDEQELLALFKQSLMKYRSYLRQAHFDGKPLNEISVKSSVLHLSDSDWNNNVVTHRSRL